MDIGFKKELILVPFLVFRANIYMIYSSFTGKTKKDTKNRNFYDLILICLIKNNNNTMFNPSSNHIIKELDIIPVIGGKDKLNIFSSKQTLIWHIIWIMYNNNYYYFGDELR